LAANLPLRQGSRFLYQTFPNFVLVQFRFLAVSELYRVMGLSDIKY
jgi:hypothetical protein